MDTTRSHDVRVGTNRCPFCHEDVHLDHADWVSCRSCQARHHEGCWDEHGACAACGDGTRMQTPAQHVIRRLRSGPGALFVPALLTPSVLLLLSGTAGPTWLGVFVLALMATVLLQRLLSPVMTLDPGGLEFRRGVSSLDVRYAEVVESRPGSLPRTWGLTVRKPGGGTRYVSLPLFELRAADRAEVRAILERLQPGERAATVDSELKDAKQA